MKTDRSHARKVCLAVLEKIVERDRIEVSGYEWSDEVERDQPAVDLTARTSVGTLALEHTRIESFEGQIEHYFQVQAWIEPLRELLKGALPEPGHYVLAFAAGVARGFKPDAASLRALEAWIRARAPGLEIGSPQTAPRHFVSEVPPGFPFEVSLYRWSRGRGEITFVDFVPDDLEGRRRLRIRLALEAKLPKLDVARRQGAKSVLVLESNDIALANASAIASALVDEIGRLQDAVPDHVWLVETDGEPWEFWEIKRGSEVFGADWKRGHHQMEAGAREKLVLRWSLRVRQRPWRRFAEWETGQGREPGRDFGRALDWMWQAWQLAKARDPAWSDARVDHDHVRRLREASMALARLRPVE